MFYILIFILIGCLVGTFTGLVPGIHTNLVAVFILTYSFLFDIEAVYLVCFVVSLAITHTFLDFIPSIFLGAPNEDNALSILPGHRFLLKGQGYYAVWLSLVGSMGAIILLVLILPLMVFVLPLIYPFLTLMMGWILIWVSILLIFSEKSSRFAAFFIFILAGFLGIAVFGLSVNQPLTPLLTGLFGASSLIFAIKSNVKIPKQEISREKMEKKEFIKPFLATSLISPICSFLPGIGSSEAAVIGSKIFGKMDEKQFLIFLGSINTLVMAVSFFVIILIGKARTGAAELLNQIVKLDFSFLKYIILAIILSSVIAFILGIFLSRIFSKVVGFFNYGKICFVILILLVSIVFFISGFLGILVFLVSSILGLTCISIGVPRSFLMGCLLIPTILFYLPF